MTALETQPFAGDCTMTRAVCSQGRSIFRLQPALARKSRAETRGIVGGCEETRDGEVRSRSVEYKFVKSDAKHRETSPAVI